MNRHTHRCASRPRCDIGGRSMGARSGRWHVESISTDSMTVDRVTTLHQSRFLQCFSHPSHHSHRPRGLVLFNLLIVVHELGHFLAARWRGLFIEQVWHLVRQTALEKENQRRAVYRSARCPSAVSWLCRSSRRWTSSRAKRMSIAPQLPPISALDKIIVAFAGPLFSFLLALVFRRASSGWSVIR